jgi:hypothetical protein
VEPKERIKTVATAAMSAVKAQLGGERGEQPTPTAVDAATVEMIVEQWPAMSKKAVEEIMNKYGLPSEATLSRLTWYNTGPWKRTVVLRDQIPHNFPQPHTDVVEQVIDYRVPPEKASELSKFDGSLIVERTKGEVIARCDMEAANILSINVMHDIVSGVLTAEEGRKKFCEVSAAYVMNRPAPYAEAFQFPLPHGQTADADKTEMMSELMQQAGNKVKDAFRDKGPGGVH